MQEYQNKKINPPGNAETATALQIIGAFKGESQPRHTPAPDNGNTRPARSGRHQCRPWPSAAEPGRPAACADPPAAWPPRWRRCSGRGCAAGPAEGGAGRAWLPARKDANETPKRGKSKMVKKNPGFEKNAE